MWFTRVYRVRASGSKFCEKIYDSVFTVKKSVEKVKMFIDELGISLLLYNIFTNSFGFNLLYLHFFFQKLS